MTTKVVCRLLDAGGALLGWVSHEARARGDGRIWSQGAIRIVASVSGMPAVLSVHWADVNVEARIPCKAPAVIPGQVVTVVERSQPLLMVGEPPTNLAPITVGEPVQVAVPVGGIGVRPR